MGAEVFQGDCGGCTFAGMYHTFPHLASRGRLLDCSRGRVAPRRSPFESRECLQCPNSTSFEPQTSLLGRPPNSFSANCRGGLEALDPLLQFRTSACLILGSLPLEGPTSFDFAAFLLCRGKRALLPLVTKREKSANYGPVGRTARHDVLESNANEARRMRHSFLKR